MPFNIYNNGFNMKKIHVFIALILIVSVIKLHNNNDQKQRGHLSKINTTQYSTAYIAKASQPLQAGFFSNNDSDDERNITKNNSGSSNYIPYFQLFLTVIILFFVVISFYHKKTKTVDVEQPLDERKDPSPLASNEQNNPESPNDNIDKRINDIENSLKEIRELFYLDKDKPYLSDILNSINNIHEDIDQIKLIPNNIPTSSSGEASIEYHALTQKIESINTAINANNNTVISIQTELNAIKLLIEKLKTDGASPRRIEI